MSQGVDPYLAEVRAGMIPDASVDPMMSAAPPPEPAMSGEPLGPPASLALPSPPNGPPNAPGGIAHPSPLENIDVNSPSPGPEGAPPGPVAPEVHGHGQFDLTPIGGGGITPAHEVEMRGPTLRNQQGVANAATNAAIGSNTANSEATARAEYEQALGQERAARAREAAMQQSIAERDQEMQDRQQDFDDSVRSLSKMSLDPNRFWATRSTGQKVSAVVSMALGGFLQGARGGSNPGLDAINTMIDRDIHAQEVGFQAARDTVNAKQTAFGLAMQKYQNVDAARSMARAAALDAVQAQLGQNAALWKDTDAANRANSAIAALEDIKTQQIAQGMRFVLPTQQGRMFVDSNGLRYTEAEAKALGKEFRGYEQARELKGLDTAGAILQEGAKLGAQKNAQRENKLNEETRFIAEKLQGAGVPQARASADIALRALAASPGGINDAVARTVVPDSLHGKVMSDKSNTREQAYWNFQNAAMKAMMGNVTEGEFARAQKQLGSATDPESRRRAINNTLETLSEIEKGIKAGASPEAQSTYDAQREAASGEKAPAPASAKKGW